MTEARTPTPPDIPDGRPDTIESRMPSRLMKGRWPSQRAVLIGLGTIVVAGVLMYGLLRNDPSVVTAAESVATVCGMVVDPNAPRPLHDIEFKMAYQWAYTEPMIVVDPSTCDERLAQSFYFHSRTRPPQYIWVFDVTGRRTEQRSKRSVDETLEYSTVTFYEVTDSGIEGMGASNVRLIRYRLNLRKNLEPVPNPRHGAPPRGYEQSDR